MVLEGKTKFRKGNFYYFIYLPKRVATDSQFPFKINDDVIIQIRGNELIIKKDLEGK